MALRDRITGVGSALVDATGQILTGFGEALLKASEEDNTSAPGGSNEDTAASAPVPTEAAENDPKSLFFDPFAIIEQLGYRDRPSQITYGTLKSMVYKTHVVGAVIQTRLNQIAAFARPSHDRYHLGFRLKTRETQKQPTKAEQDWIQQAETFMMRTGVTDNPRGRDNFEEFLRKFMFDSLVFDQSVCEVVPNKKGIPAEFYAVDAATIRKADTATTYFDEDVPDQIKYVQIYDGTIISEFTESELCFGVRNPRSDIRLYGYGTSELEMMLTAVTSYLWSFEHNSRNFSQGMSQKGIINFKGAVPEKQLNAFRRHWSLMVQGVSNTGRTPITNAEDLQYIPMDTSNRDMEYNAFMDWLIKILCAFYSIDPVEVNFKYGNTGQKGGLNEGGNKEKITESKERGLRPLLRFIATCINQHIIWPMNENFEFEFVGLDAQTHAEAADLAAKQVKTTRTVDELRAEDDLEPLPNGLGEIILDPTWLQNKQQADMAAQGGEPGQPGTENGDDDEYDFESLLSEQEEDENGEEEEQEKPPKQENKEPDDKNERMGKSLTFDLTI